MADYPRVKMQTSEGLIELELWSDVAPGHVENFLKLTDQGYYNGLTFHRIVPGFVIQGGCPRGDGTGGPGWTISAEFNDRAHRPGVLSMARTNDPNSAGSQFFICLTRENCRALDGNYTAFGEVVGDGLAVVEKIAATPLADRQAGRPRNPPVMEQVERIEAAEPSA